MREWNREKGRCFLEKSIFTITYCIYLALFMDWFTGKAALGQTWRSLSNLEVFNPRSDTALQGVWGRTRLFSGLRTPCEPQDPAEKWRSSSPGKAKPGRRLQRWKEDLALDFGKP